mmetsp:Transcript_73440/g.157359  ORF Transcript_73440/g.157359 Transcript_73440/m.157359 type:complete len:175 (-) Transcript_73440:152-676(-)
MKPDWDKLMKNWNKSKRGATGLIADVDCTAAGKDLCEKVGVKGFPTLKWGDPNSLEDYEGGRTYDDLKQFALKNIKPICSPTNLDLCDEDKKKEIANLQAMPADELSAAIAEKQQAIEDAEAEFKQAVEELQAQYKKLDEDKSAKVAEVKKSGLGLMLSVQAMGAKKLAGSEEL